MIQRVQTIFLFLVALFMVMMLFFDLWSKEDPATQQAVQLNVFELVHSQQGKPVAQQNTIYIVGLVFLSNILAFTSIFSYKSRTRQLLINLVNNLVMVAAFAICMYLTMDKADKAFAGGQGAYGIAMFMPVAALVMNLAANYFIRKDEKLVRSVDRLR